MGEFFATGRVVDCILLLMLTELVVLSVTRRRSGRGLSTVQALVSLSAGAALLLALRSALLGSPWPWIALWLVVALAAHLFDIRSRWN